MKSRTMIAHDKNGEEMFAESNVDTSDMPKDHNKGKHRIYAGGKYDSFLYLPVIPEQE